MQPLVSVVTITYNHAPYIAKCIEGVLMQQVNFPMEFVIAEDCSTDGTRSICEEYAMKYPDLIRLLPSKGNMGAVLNEQRAFEAARGKYIATCEGDDYWTDPLKLQRQVDFLEKNPDYSACFHRYKKRYEAEDRTEEADKDLFPLDVTDKDSKELSMYSAMHRWQTQYLSMVFRRECYPMNLPERYHYFRDTHQVYHLMLAGRCRLFAFYGGVYNITGSGIYSDMTALRQEQMALAVDTELWKVNDDKRWREMCAVVMQHILDAYHAGLSCVTRIHYAVRIFIISHGFKKLLKNLFK